MKWIKKILGIEGLEDKIKFLEQDRDAIMEALEKASVANFIRVITYTKDMIFKNPKPPISLDDMEANIQTIFEVLELNSLCSVSRMRLEAANDE